MLVLVVFRYAQPFGSRGVGKRDENLYHRVSTTKISLKNITACFGLTETLICLSGRRNNFVFTLEKKYFIFPSRVSKGKNEEKTPCQKNPTKTMFKCQTEFSVFLSYLMPFLLFTFKVYFRRLLRCFGVFLWGKQIETDQYLLSLKGLLKRQLTTNCLAAVPSLISGSPKVQAEMNSVMGHFRISPSG